MWISQVIFVILLFSETNRISEVNNDNICLVVRYIVFIVDVSTRRLGLHVWVRVLIIVLCRHWSMPSRIDTLCIHPYNTGQVRLRT